jgi:lysophospholipase L1-like esterase
VTPARREILGRLALLLAGSAAALGLAEAVLRLLDPFQERLRGDQLRLPHHVQFVIDNTTNPRLDGRIRHSKNALGFRGPDLPRDRHGRLLTFAVGGSTTECFYLSDGRDWPAVVAGRLRCAVPRLWMNNSGLDGFSSFGPRHLLEQRILRLRPNVVLFLEGVTDVGREDLDRLPSPSGVELLARHSGLVSTFLNAWRTRQATARGLRHYAMDLRSAQHMPTDRARLARGLRRHERAFLPGYRERLEQLVELCQAHAALPVLVTQPALFGSGRDDLTGVDLETLSAGDSLGWGSVGGERWNGAMSWALLESYNDVTRSVSAAYGVPLIDLARMRKSSRFYYDVIHFTNEGAAEVARIVAAELCPILARRGLVEEEADCACVPE